ncbi:MAG: excinuclease ABC subunit UvrA [Candidatus Cloacimonetes bacterium]|nr:excinuclease ABC subunit UvrA [Candidatus Cloacimonadota bacterium]
MKNSIIIKGASEHNLKNIDLELPRNELIIFTGVSGSGKTSLAFDTLYAEGQRRYVESLSSYARQFLGLMEKPKVDYIEGLSPAISIDQKSASKNPRSTVGTVTEIYDYLRILFARIGVQHCYQCGDEVASQSIDQIVSNLMELPEKTKIQILAPLIQSRKGEHRDEFEKLRKDGFSRVIVNGQVRDLTEDISLDKKYKHNIDVIVDRIVIKENIHTRLTDSIETCLRLTNGLVKIDFTDEKRQEIISEHNACAKCGISYPDLIPQNFSYNSPLGMCSNCNGLGTKLEFDPDKIIIDPTLSINEGAVDPWGKLGDKKSGWTNQKILSAGQNFNFSLDTPWQDLNENVQKMLLYGARGRSFKVNYESKDGSSYQFNTKMEGIIPVLERRMKETSSENMKQWYLRYISDKPCHECDGTRLKKEVVSVKIDTETIVSISKKSISEALEFFHQLKLSGNKKIIAFDLLKEIVARLRFLENVGLHYLTLDRRSPTLSGGESQRIRLASQIGSGLVGVMYILDEPSIGLHQRDNSKLIDTLIHLRDIGNTIIVVEHDEDMMKSANKIVDFGPRAGINGGEIIAYGDINYIQKCENSLTGMYLSGKLKIDFSDDRRNPSKDFIKIVGAKQNNLKNINIDIPVGLFTCVTGVSGSGKSSLINQVLLPVAVSNLNKATVKPGKVDKILGLEKLDKVIAIDQQPIGRTPRSNPATYIKLYDVIRNLFAELPAAKLRGYTPGRFSFNVKGGRCESCEGAGVKLIEMHFLPDVYVTCEICKGKRYNQETLQVLYKDHSIADILGLDVSQAHKIFENIPTISKKLQTLLDVGLDYIKLGQSATTLSGGEAQRVKLARELSKTSTGKTLYILDEPTTGLHFDDINKLLTVLQRLVDMGNTIIVIEHNLDVVKCADYIIDLGPEGGDKGGYIIAKGTPEEIILEKKSATGKYLKKKLI